MSMTSNTASITASASLINHPSTSTTRATVLTTQLLNFPTFTPTSKSSSNTTIGISVGIPVGIFVIALFICLCYVYIKREKLNNSNRSFSPNGKYSSSNSAGFLKKCFGVEHKDNYDLEQNPLREKPWLFENNQFSTNVRYEIPGTTVPKKETVPHVLTPAKATRIHENRQFHQKGKYFIPFNSLDTSKTMGTTKPHVLEINDDGTNSNLPNKRFTQTWKYKSPLSKWFLNSSNDLTNDGYKPKTKMKSSNILLKVDKNYANEEIIESSIDERSPILQVHNQSYGKLTGKDNLNESNQSIANEQHRVSVIYDDLKSTTTLPRNIYPMSPVDANGRKLRRDSRFQKCGNDTVMDLATPKEESQIDKDTKIGNDITTGSICEVIKNYSPRLTDEIQINLGEYVQVLATHTDTWCLVEKCEKDGTSLPKIDLTSSNDISHIHYLNKNRGIVPGDCLASI